MINWKEHFDYNPTNGSITRKPRPRESFPSLQAFVRWNTMYLGKTAGNDDGEGYFRCRVLNRSYRVHRIVWELHHGEVPEGMVIDHINRIRNDNRIENLRLATFSQNLHNSKVDSRNTSGHKGVGWIVETRKWQAKVTINRKSISLGCFVLKSDAVAAAITARKEMLGDFVGETSVEP